MPAKYPPFPTGPKTGMGIPGNDSRHNFTDPNQGGGPRPGNKTVPASQKGGFGHQGRDRVHVRAGMSGARAGSGNPASRGGFNGQARGGSFNPESRISAHGGSPQTRSNIPAPANRGGFGHSGQQGVPGVRSNPQPGAGNLAGRSAKLITGRFNRKAMGAQPGQGDAMGSYGSPPVTANT